MVRDENGRFVAGHEPTNNGKGGRPKRAIEDRFIGILRDTVTPDDWKTIILTAIAGAKSGRDADRQWLSDWLQGKPVERKEIDVVGDLRVVMDV